MAESGGTTEKRLLRWFREEGHCLKLACEWWNWEGERFAKYSGDKPVKFGDSTVVRSETKRGITDNSKILDSYQLSSIGRWVKWSYSGYILQVDITWFSVVLEPSLRERDNSEMLSL